MMGTVYLHTEAGDGQLMIMRQELHNDKPPAEVKYVKIRCVKCALQGPYWKLEARKGESRGGASGRVVRRGLEMLKQHFKPAAVHKEDCKLQN